MDGAVRYTCDSLSTYFLNIATSVDMYNSGPLTSEQGNAGRRTFTNLFIHAHTQGNEDMHSSGVQLFHLSDLMPILWPLRKVCAEIITATEVEITAIQ